MILFASKRNSNQIGLNKTKTNEKKKSKKNTPLKEQREKDRYIVSHGPQPGNQSVVDLVPQSK